jgi:oxygen-independent coproporphyrinogen-3 oxidase
VRCSISSACAPSAPVCGATRCRRSPATAGVLPDHYWHFGDYLGIGAGAHGKLSFPHRVVRQQRWREPMRYIEQALAGQAVSNEQEVARAALPFEFMLNVLRLREGFELALFTERTGLPLSAVSRALDIAERRGLIAREPGRIRPTAHGFDFLSDLQQLFLPPG